MDGGHDDFEHIIIDGASTDGTLAVIERLQHEKMIVVCERDRGIYDAMNKGIALASGVYIATLNADDYYQEGALADVHQKLKEDSTIDILHSDLVYLRNGNTQIVESSMRGNCKFRDAPHHPTTFVKSSVYSELGRFDVTYTISADYDFLLRCKGALKNFCFSSNPSTVMRYGGVSTSNWREMHQQMASILEKHGAPRHELLQYKLNCWLALVKSELKKVLSAFSPGGKTE